MPGSKGGLGAPVFSDHDIKCHDRILDLDQRHGIGRIDFGLRYENDAGGSFREVS